MPQSRHYADELRCPILGEISERLRRTISRMRQRIKFACYRVSQRLLRAGTEAACATPPTALARLNSCEPRRSFPRALSMNSLEFGAAYQTSSARKTLRPTLGSF